MAKSLGGLNSPVNESQGGTNATTFNAARTNMGLNALVNEQNAGYTALESDRNKLIHYTGAGGVTLALDPAATLLDGWSCIVRNDAASSITINPDGAELIDGAATLTLEPTRAINIYCTGTEFLTQGQSSEIDGANQALSNLASVAINTTLVSDTDVTDNLGTQAIRWNTAYLQNLQTGDTAADVLNIGAWDVDGAAINNFITLTAGNTPTCVLASGVTAVTQSPSDNSTKIATTAYVDAVGGSMAAAMGPLSGFWYPSGALMGAFSQTNGQRSTATGTIYYVPFFVAKTTTFQKIGILIGTTAAGNSNFCLYNHDGAGKPTGSPIANSTSGSKANVASTFLTHTFGSTITLNAGIYWGAFTVSGTSTIYGNAAALGRATGLGLSATPTAANIATPNTGWSEAFAYNTTMPNVGGSLTQVLLNGTGDSFVFLQAN